MTDQATQTDAGDGRRRRPGLVVAVAIGLLEAAVLVGYALSIVGFEFVGTTSGVGGATDVAPFALVANLLIFGALVAAISLALRSGKDAARTPFIVAQAFIVVSAWTLATADIGWERAAGVLAIALAVTAAVLALATAS